MNILRDIFIYSPESPLIFTRLYFWIFFALVLLVYSALYKQNRVRHAYLFLVSLFFYYKSSGFYFSLLVFSTLVDYFIALLMYRYDSFKIKRLMLLVLSLVINLGVLSYFKYAYFFTDIFNMLFGTDIEVVNHFAIMANSIADSGFDIDKIILPVGISFFTFQTISYSIDVYKRRIEPVRSIVDFGFYVSFFPQLVAGPIVRANEFIPQLYHEYKVSYAEFGLALFMILKGLVKKVFISDYISLNFVDRVFSNPLTFTGFENLMALYGYSLQVYADFSGYTDIAIGVAILLGYRLPINFNSPYKSLHVGEFWKRWHISLSTWLKDYLYIPLGGNKEISVFSQFSILLTFVLVVVVPEFSYLSFALMCASIVLYFINLKLKNKYLEYSNVALLAALAIVTYGNNWYAFGFAVLVVMLWGFIYFKDENKIVIFTNINLFLTMLLGGLWHGASWQFVIWGALNGLGLVVYKLWRKVSPFTDKKGWAVRFYAIFLTFNFITFTRIWFRAESMEKANAIIHQITHAFDFTQIIPVIISYKYVFGLMLFGYVIHWLSSNIKQSYENWFINSPNYVKVALSAIIVLIIYQAQTADLQPFIYFQF